MSGITRYNAKESTVLVGGVNITGLGEDMVSGEKDEDFTETSVGAQGDVVVNEVNNTLGSVTIKIQHTSPQKSYLTNLAGNKGFVSVWGIKYNFRRKIWRYKSEINKLSINLRGCYC